MYFEYDVTLGSNSAWSKFRWASRASRTSERCGQHSPTDTLLCHSGTDTTLGGVYSSRIFVNCWRCINVARILSNAISHRYFIVLYRKPILSRPNDIVKI